MSRSSLSFGTAISFSLQHYKLQTDTLHDKAIVEMGSLLDCIIVDAQFSLTRQFSMNMPTIFPVAPQIYYKFVITCFMLYSSSGLGKDVHWFHCDPN